MKFHFNLPFSNHLGFFLDLEKIRIELRNVFFYENLKLKKVLNSVLI